MGKGSYLGGSTIINCGSKLVYKSREKKYNGSSKSKSVVNNFSSEERKYKKQEKQYLRMEKRFLKLIIDIVLSKGVLPKSIPKKIKNDNSLGVKAWAKAHPKFKKLLALASKEKNVLIKAKKMKPGKYRHFRTGQSYDVIGVALNVETNQKMVMYRALYECADLQEEYGHHPYFVRPYEMFFETVEHDGKTVPRFEYIGE